MMAIAESARLMEMKSLKKIELIYRNRLSMEPCDAEARTRLAWCLCLEALFRAGQENVLSSLSRGTHRNKEDNTFLLSLFDEKSESLFRDCIQQSQLVR